MSSEYNEIKDIEPLVVDMTIHDEHPEISVRMPIYNLKSTHDEFYLEIRYKPAPDGRYSCYFTLSDQLLAVLASSKAAVADLPLMMPDQVPSPWGLGPPEHVHVAVGKLREFHENRGYAPHFSKYGK